MYGFRLLEATEEKALLRAKSEVEAHTTGNSARQRHRPPVPRHPYATATPRLTSDVPPRFLPCPPVEYVQETQEVDMRWRAVSFTFLARDTLFAFALLFLFVHL